MIRIDKVCSGTIMIIMTVTEQCPALMALFKKINSKCNVPWTFSLHNSVSKYGNWWSQWGSPRFLHCTWPSLYYWFFRWDQEKIISFQTSWVKMLNFSFKAFQENNSLQCCLHSQARIVNKTSYIWLWVYKYNLARLWPEEFSAFRTPPKSSHA